MNKLFNNYIGFAALIFVLVFSCKQEQNLPDPYQAGWNGEKVCEVLEDNDYLRVLKCTFPAGVGHEKHYHEPHFGYALVGGTFKLEEATGTREVSFPTGYSWSKDEVSEHQVLNVGDSASVFLIIEYK
ncbi:cupin domain-containing protein [Flavobacteriaceae bacterium S0825]|uniref:cupin domain-containing protein n=1 Tax=Gaetbulibacter sp. S0825 TaxID=2720084 RepID=UPI0014316557|nr:cupin domain-containing protein [Gaetbulibacter sp. S0825]MCK0109343.1 cupin domain-containing protein [Flavobacteriaceae bacterium S0825]NIX64977.1 cupin domain-containing protein [Gaetbulibacter sp. S0825]